MADADLAIVLADQVRAATQDRRALRIIGGDTKAWRGRATDGEPLEMSGHRGVIDYDPSELVITARAGTPLAEIEALLEANHQCLGFEPPSFGPTSTIGGVVAAGLAGPARPFAGAVRDHLLGARVMDGRGRALRFGGKVFKNVAGFDAFRLMCGAMGTLGVLLDVSIRVSPLPRTRRTVTFEMDWPAAQSLLIDALRRPWPIDGACHLEGRLHIRLSGPVEGVRLAAGALRGAEGDPALWAQIRDLATPGLRAPRLWRLSVPRTARTEAPGASMIFDWAGAQVWSADRPTDDLAASLGGHLTLFRGAGPGEAAFAPLTAPLFALHRRLKAVFDPAGVFNPGRLYEGL